METNDAHVKNRSVLDRRSGSERRRSYSLDYFLKGGRERRKLLDRRTRSRDRRKRWIKVDESTSVPEDI